MPGLAEEGGTAAAAACRADFAVAIAPASGPAVGYAAGPARPPVVATHRPRMKFVISPQPVALSMAYTSGIAGECASGYLTACYAGTGVGNASMPAQSKRARGRERGGKGHERPGEAAERE